MADIHYQPKRVFVSRPIEFWRTDAHKIVLKNTERYVQELERNSYIKEVCMDTLFKRIEKHISDDMKIQSKGFKDFISMIVDEHYEMTRNVDNNLHYLWHLYRKGTKAGDYKPFILMAEMQLLKEMGYLSEDEIQNMWNMIDSKDEDNFNLVWMALRTLRLTRVHEHGEYGKRPTDVYTPIVKDYPSKILNHELFLKTGNK